MTDRVPSETRRMKQAVVLVPGLACDTALYQYQLEHLADIAEMTVVDLHPYGSRAEMADAVLKAAPARFALSGASMGGWVAQEVASRASERVTKLALVGTCARPDTTFMQNLQEAITKIEAGRFEEVCEELIPLGLRPSRLKEPELLQALGGMVRRAGPAVFVRQGRAMLKDYDSRALLPRISCPTLVLAARQDALFPVEEAAFIAASSPAGRRES